MPRNKIAELDKAVVSGIWPDRFSLNAPLWIDGANVQFDDKGVLSMQGYSSAGTKIGTVPVRGMFQHISGANRNLYFGDTTQIFLWDGSSITSVGSGYTGNQDSAGTDWDSGTTFWDSGSTTWDGTFGTLASVWSMTDFGSWVLATNGKDAPQIKKGASFAALSGPDFTTAEVFVKSGPHILAFNTSVNNRGFAWCHADDPETWVPTSTNSAGDLIIREIDSEIIAAAPLANQVMVYGEKSMFAVRYIGSPLYFGYSQVLSNRGAASKMAVVTVGRRQYVMSEDAFYMTDGSTYQDIDNDDIRNHVFGNFNVGQKRKIASWHDEENTEIRWYYPSSGTQENDKGVGYNYVTKLWTLYTEAKTSAIGREVFTTPFSTGSDGTLYTENSGNDANGSALTCHVTTKPLDLDNEDHVKELDAIRVGYKGSGLTFRIGTQDTLSDTIVWGDYQTAQSSFDFTELRKAGRYISIEFRSNTLGANWQLGSVSLYGRLSGTR